MANLLPISAKSSPKLGRGDDQRAAESPLGFLTHDSAQTRASALLDELLAGALIKADELPQPQPEEYQLPGTSDNKETPSKRWHYNQLKPKSRPQLSIEGKK